MTPWGWIIIGLIIVAVLLWAFWPRDEGMY